MKSYSIAVLPGDGAGPEVIREGQRAVEAVADNFSIEWVSYPYGAAHYLRTGETLPDQAVEEISALNAVYLGPFGNPKVSRSVIERHLLRKLRNSLDQFAEVMPVKLYPNVKTPFANVMPGDVDLLIVRDNTEDFQVGIGGSFWKGTPGEIAVQAGVVSKKGSQRVIGYAFGLAKKEKRKRVTSCDKADIMPHSYGLWRKVLCEEAKKHKKLNVKLELINDLIPTLAANPSKYEVIVAPSLFGDILLEIGAMLQGGRGMSFCSDVSERGICSFKALAMPEAPKGRVNPLGAALSGALMLEHLGERKAAGRIRKAIWELLGEGKARTEDIGGSSTTGEVGSALEKKLIR